MNPVDFVFQDSELLLDLKPLLPIPKVVPPLKEQLSNESRRFWNNVTSAILSKQYPQATKLKQEIEERQREKANQRAASNEEWTPRFFTAPIEPDGRPRLSDEGTKALRGLQAADFHLEESKVTGA